MTDFIEEILSHVWIDPAHKPKLEEVHQYMNKEKISELLNEILTNIMLEKPENVKEFIVEQLWKVKKRQIGD